MQETHIMPCRYQGFYPVIKTSINDVFSSDTSGIHYSRGVTHTAVVL